MNHLLKTIAVTSLIVAMPNTAIAGEAENLVLNQVRQTYGIDKLKTITIHSDLRFGWIGQGYTPDYVERTRAINDQKMDLVNSRGSVEAWGGPLNNFNTRTVSTTGGVGHINYVAKTYNVDADGTYHGVFGGRIRTSDTLLAYELVNRPGQSTVKETTTYLGIPHTVVTLSIPDWPPMDIYVNTDTGHITKMQRTIGFGPVKYQFADFKKTSGVTYASDYNFFLENLLIEYAVERSIKVNSVSPKTWQIDKGHTLEGKTVDGSKMSVNTVSDAVHHVGMGGGYTSFIDAGDYIIGVGNSAGLKERWAAYKEAQEGNTKPLKYMVVTHHHADHIDGVKEGYDLGADIIVTKMAAQSVKGVIGDAVLGSRIHVMGKEKNLGPIKVYDIATSHVGSFALVYVPASKTIIQVDHYNGNFVDGPSPAHQGGLTLKAEINRLGLDVDTLLSLHGRKVESWENFSAAVKAYNPKPCPSGRKICR